MRFLRSRFIRAGSRAPRSRMPSEPPNFTINRAAPELRIANRGRGRPRHSKIGEARANRRLDSWRGLLCRNGGEHEQFSRAARAKCIIRNRSCRSSHGKKEIAGNCPASFFDWFVESTPESSRANRLFLYIFTPSRPIRSMKLQQVVFDQRSPQTCVLFVVRRAVAASLRSRRATAGRATGLGRPHDVVSPYRL